MHRRGDLQLLFTNFKDISNSLSSIKYPVEFSFTKVVTCEKKLRFVETIFDRCFIHAFSGTPPGSVVEPGS